MDFETIIEQIRNAVYGVEVREAIAGMGEYLEEYFHECASKIGDAIQSAKDAAASAEKAAQAESSASTSASTAADHEKNAGTKAAEAANSASAAKASEKAAEASANKAAAAISTDKTLSIEDVPADSKATGDAVTALEGDIRYIKLKMATNVTQNPFEVSFSTLDDVTVTGVWNTSSTRIEF